MLTNPKEDIPSCCPKVGDGAMDDVDSSLHSPGAEMDECGWAVTPFMKVLMCRNDAFWEAMGTGLTE
jgi:hypothetical protein